MELLDSDALELPATADFHVHLRDGEMMKTVVPTIRSGGVNTVFVMPNLIPPITTVQQCLAYKQRLEAIEPNVHYLMSLYLHESITPQTIIDAKASGAIYGVKSYPAGVTTNSSSGVIDYQAFYPVFAEMQRQDLVLNLHGECPSSNSTAHSDAEQGITVLNAEAKFLPTLLSIHAAFPRLRIVLEHCTTAAALAAVQSCSGNVVGTITAHHLFLTIDDVVGNNAHFCKPVAKTVEDRAALLRAAVSGNPKFFLGTDSAPHPRSAKVGADVFGKCGVAAGVFTQPYATQTVLDALAAGIERRVLRKEQVTLAVLEAFLSGFGREFYRVPDARRERIVLRRGAGSVVDVLRSGTVEVVPFRAGAKTWSVEWKTSAS